MRRFVSAASSRAVASKSVLFLRSETLCVGHLTTAPYLRQKFAWWDCARAADQRRDESVQLFQIHGAFVAEPAKSLGEIIEFGVGRLWRSHSTFLLHYGTVNLADFETSRERSSGQFALLIRGSPGQWAFRPAGEAKAEPNLIDNAFVAEMIAGEMEWAR